MFYITDVVNNKDLTPSMPSWLLNKDETPIKVEKVDQYAVKFTFAAPQTLFLPEIAQQDAGDKKYPMFLPAHYLKQFHTSYIAKADLDKLVADAGVKTWGELFYLKQDQFDNPDRPVLTAWVAKNRYSEQIFIMERNPYYFGVDQAGNQLPYIDTVEVKFFADKAALNLAAIAGELDEQERHIDLANYPVLKEEEQKSGKYKIFLWSSTGGEEAGVVFNLTYQGDPELTAMWSQLDFRKAVSYAINRPEIQESIFLGTGEAAPRHHQVDQPVVSRRRVGLQVHRVQAGRGQQAAGRAGLHQAGRRRLPPAAEWQARRLRALGRACPGRLHRSR